MTDQRFKGLRFESHLSFEINMACDCTTSSNHCLWKSIYRAFDLQADVKRHSYHVARIKMKELGSPFLVDMMKKVKYTGDSQQGSCQSCKLSRNLVRLFWSKTKVGHLRVPYATQKAYPPLIYVHKCAYPFTNSPVSFKWIELQSRNRLGLKIILSPQVFLLDFSHFETSAL